MTTEMFLLNLFFGGRILYLLLSNGMVILAIFLQEYALTKQPVWISVEIYKIFKLFKKIGLSIPVAVIKLSSNEEGFLPNLLFELV